MPTKTKLTPEESFQQLVAFTEEQNAKFKKATKAKRRVMIAKDVIAALKAKRLRAKAGHYIEIGSGEYNDRQDFNKLLEANIDGSFQDLLPKLPTCTVCAKGALFTCTVLRQNEVKNDQLTGRRLHAGGVFDSPELSKLLQGLFTAAQLTKIENEFECRRIQDHGPYAVMGLQRFSAEKRLEKIMRNIVANDGTFKPVRDFKYCRTPKEQNADWKGLDSED